MTFDPHPHDDRSSVGPIAAMKLAALRERLEYLGEIDLAARSAGAISPLATFHPGPGKGFGHEVTLNAAGYIDAAENILWSPPEDEIETTEAEAAAALFRESEYVRHCKNRAGEVVSDEAWRESQTSRETIARQSREAALALTSAGIPAFLPPTVPRASICDPETESELKPLPLRRVNYFPQVAQQRRADMVKHLEAFLITHPDTQLMTLTAGRRLFVRSWEELRGAIGAFHRRISFLNAGWLFDMFGFELVFRGTELGTVSRVFASPFPRESGTEGGVWALSVHLHAHCFGRYAQRPADARRSCFCRLMHIHWGAMWNFAGSINAAREACKYPVKPSDMDGLENADHVTLFKAMRGMKLVQPMGELRTAIRSRFADGLKGRRWTVPQKEGGTRLELRFRPDWNAKPRDLKGRANRAALRERDRKQALAWLVGAVAALSFAKAAFGIAQTAFKAGAFKLAFAWQAVAFNAHRLGVWLATYRFRPYEERAFFGQRVIKEAERLARAKKAPPRNQIVARLAPATYFDRVTRPALLVWNFNGDWAALRSQAFVREYLDAVRPKIAAAVGEIRAENENAANEAIESGLLEKVHTSHATVLSEKTRKSLILEPEGVA